ncbi:MAG: AsmA-like C-terminal region-containing protein, partial [Desulfobulbaceae bacterium]|nr:AsmA-like C-terminal region-containing protein [Desulfobulbaceae bacterium]
SKTLATVLQLEELRSLALDKVDGNLQLKKGKLYLRSLLNGADIKAETDGNVDINSGKLDLPVKLEFSGAMAEKLRQKASFMKYLSDKEGTTAVNLKLSGTTAAPKAVLDTAAAGKQIQKKLEQKAIDEIGKKLLGTPPAEEDGKSAEPVKQIFKGLFGN